MAKGYDKGRSRGGMQYAPSPDAVLVKKLGEIVSDLYMSTDERDIKRLWGSAHRLLLKSKADPQRIETVIKQHRVGALSMLVTELGAADKPTLRPADSGSVSAIAPAADRSAALPKEPRTAPEEPVDLDASGAAKSIPNAKDEAGRTPRDGAGPTAAQLKSGLKAFRKRLKLTRLDDESRIGNRAMTGGRKSSVVAIMPPREYPSSVWQELVKQGKLKNAGNGFYELVGE